MECENQPFYSIYRTNFYFIIILSEFSIKINSALKNSPAGIQNINSFTSFDLDSTSYSQCTITSFYGDTTTCPSPLGSDIVLTPLSNPPSRREVTASLLMYGLKDELAEEPFYSNPRDSSTTKEVGLNVIRLRSKYSQDLEEFKGSYYFPNWKSQKPSKKRTVIIQPAIDPPSSVNIKKELEMLSYMSGSFADTRTSQETINVNQHLKPKVFVKKNIIIDINLILWCVGFWCQINFSEPVFQQMIFYKDDLTVHVFSIF